ncbi:MAG: DUF1616 domain-containing protein [Thermoplasmata archaeon]|nr:DUF1616 domain-containing protein [Thermoplasmata archaeon]
MIDVFRLLIGVVLLYFLPGYTIVQFMFPRKGEFDKDWDILYRIVFSIGVSIVVVILIGWFLGALPPDPTTGKGYFQGSATGFPYIEFSIILVSAVFFVAGWYRGAYPFLGRLHPKLARKTAAPEQGPIAKEDFMDLLAGLAEEKAKAEKLLKMYEEKEKVSTGERRKYYREKIRETKARIAELGAKIEEVEERKNAEIYE